MKRFFTYLLIFIFTCSQTLPVSAFSLFGEKVNPVDPTQKVEYINIDYWKRYYDPYLADYIYQAITNNHDAKKASWLVEEYRQNVKHSLGAEFPTLSAGANYVGLKIPNIDALGLNKNAFVVPLITTYEPDLFLKNRNKTQSTKKVYEATKSDEKGIYIALASDLASAYVNILQYDKLIELQEQVLKLECENLARNQKRYNQGTINNITLNTAKQSVDNAANTLENLKSDRERILTQFTVLTGMSPDCIKDIKRGRIETFEYNASIPCEISSDVIFSRPDVMSAESLLMKSKIDVKVARKELLPTFNIFGIMVFNTISPGNFFAWDGIIAMLLAGATQNIFMGGRKIANAKISKAKYEQMFEQYRQTDLNAIKDVNDALYIVKQNTKIDNNTIHQLNLEKKNYNDSARMYSQGTISYTDLLDRQIKLLNAQQSQTQTKTTRLVNYITLYKAVGGQL